MLTLNGRGEVKSSDMADMLEESCSLYPSEYTPVGGGVKELRHLLAVIVARQDAFAGGARENVELTGHLKPRNGAGLV